MLDSMCARVSLGFALCLRPYLLSGDNGASALRGDRMIGHRRRLRLLVVYDQLVLGLHRLRVPYHGAAHHRIEREMALHEVLIRMSVVPISMFAMALVV